MQPDGEDRDWEPQQPPDEAEAEARAEAREPTRAESDAEPERYYHHAPGLEPRD